MVKPGPEGVHREDARAREFLGSLTAWVESFGCDGPDSYREVLASLARFAQRRGGRRGVLVAYLLRSVLSLRWRRLEPRRHRFGGVLILCGLSAAVFLESRWRTRITKKRRALGTAGGANGWWCAPPRCGSIGGEVIEGAGRLPHLEAKTLRIVPIAIRSGEVPACGVHPGTVTLRRTTESHLTQELNRRKLPRRPPRLCAKHASEASALRHRNQTTLPYL